jgi:hypothetical protein
MSGTRAIRTVPVVAFVVLVLGLVPGRLAPREAACAGAMALPPPCSPLSPIIDIQLSVLEHREPAVTYNPLRGEYLVVWQTVQGALTTDIWAARVNGAGEVVSSFNVVTGAAQRRTEPAVAFSVEQEQYLIVYRMEVSSTNVDLYATRADWDGSWLSQEIPVAVAVDKQVNPAVAYNAHDDEYLVVYGNEWAGGTYDVYAQRIMALDGTVLPPVSVASGATEPRRWPDVDYNAERNEYLIAYNWSGIGPMGSEQRIRGKVAVASLEGISVQPEAHLCCDGTWPPQLARVAVAAGPDEYLIAFWNGLEDTPVFGRRVSRSGEPLGPETGFLLSQSAPYARDNPDVGFAGNAYLAIWSGLTTDGASGFNVYGSHAWPGQDQAADDRFPIDERNGHTRMEAVKCAPTSHCLVVYEVEATTYSDDDIQGRIVRRCPERVYLPLVLR